MPETKNKYSKQFIGRNDGRKIYLDAPSWDCEWYWGFGYLGNRTCHYHVSGLMKDKNLKDGFDEHFGDSLIVRPSKRWEFAELFNSFYKLKSAAELFHKGSSGLTSNPCEKFLKLSDQEEYINDVALPEIFDAIYKILNADQNTKERIAELLEINLEGDTAKMLGKLADYGYSPEDYCFLGFSELDRDRLHGEFWKKYHSEKNKPVTA